ncbi:hypothetical protein [Flavobacterium sp.]|jgi:hypothetical protein|uniref:hypothetical protein n=1 Tax=Flavobacterium sp. TaxID=239 RepID=UPI0037BE519F
MSVSDNGKKVVIEYDNNKPVIRLNWYDGYRVYNLCEVIAHTFKPVKVPVKYWLLLFVCCKDRNENNCHPSNLVWKFPVKLGSEDHFGFSFIPMYSRYMVNEHGVIYDLSRNRFVKGRFIKGYFNYVLFNDLEERASLSRHRAIGLVFLDYPVNVDEMHINHKNGIKGDDEVRNLEWVSCSENRIHALDIGLINIRKAVVVENEITGEVTLVKSIRDVCSRFRLIRSIVSRKLRGVDGVYFKWPNKFYFHESEDNSEASSTTKILVRNLRTGDVAEYGSLVQCARDLKISKYTVSARVEDSWDKIYPDGLQIRRKTDVRPWYTPEDLENSILNSGILKPCLLRKCSTGEIVEYSSQRAASREIGLSESIVHQLLSSKNQPVFKAFGGKMLVQIKKKFDGNEWRIPEDYLAEYNKTKLTKDVIVRNIHTNEEKKFESAVACAKELGILTTTLNWRLKTRGQKTFDKRLQFKYLDEPLPFKLS